MPIWFYNRPIERADPTELKVAEVLNKLSDDWRIRWGYFYERKSSSGMRDREGDFILLSPDGRILVMEVKSGHLRHFVLNGIWEHDDDNPISQLNDEWSAVINDLKNGYSETIPYVGKALCLPHVNLIDQERLCAEFGRDTFILGEDLKDFPAWWQKHMASHGSFCKDPVKAFHGSIAKTLTPASLKLFIKQSDRLFEQFQSAGFSVLEMLQNNRHWMVEGGVGTGKSFLALKQAQFLAERGQGQRVLFLVFNLLLAERTKRLVSRLRLARGSIEVRSWQELLAEVIATEDLALEIPTERAEQANYFTRELPAYVDMALASGKALPQYDALIVDEAQDHDTNTSQAQSATTLGWWDWYFALLKDGTDAPIALFYDCAQRPAFRGTEGFDPKLLRAALGDAVHVHLRKALRYTSPILSYLKSLRNDTTCRWIDAIDAHEDLPTGAPVIQVQSTVANTSAAVAAILLDWKQKGLCKPTDVVVIGMRKSLQESSLAGHAQLCGADLEDFSEESIGKLGYIGAHRSKGLDFLAVIVVDFPPFSELVNDPNTNLSEAFFLAASRTRQLLAIVSKTQE